MEEQRFQINVCTYIYAGSLKEGYHSFIKEKRWWYLFCEAGSWGQDRIYSTNHNRHSSTYVALRALRFDPSVVFDVAARLSSLDSERT